MGIEALRSLEDCEERAFRTNYLNFVPDLRLIGEYVPWEDIGLLMAEQRATSRGGGMGSESLKEALGGLMSDLSSVEEELSIKLGPSDRATKRYENYQQLPDVVHRPRRRRSEDGLPGGGLASQVHRMTHLIRRRAEGPEPLIFLFRRPRGIG